MHDVIDKASNDETNYKKYKGRSVNSMTTFHSKYNCRLKVLHDMNYTRW